MKPCRICGEDLGHYFEFIKKADAHDICIEREGRFTMEEFEAAIEKARRAHGAPLPDGAIWVDALRTALEEIA